MRFSLALVLLCAVTTPVNGQRPRPPAQSAPAGAAGWRADFNGDGTPDLCQIVSTPGFTGLSCTVGGVRDAIRSSNLDLGYPEGRAWVDFDGDGKQDYCRVIGNGYPRSFATCTLSEGKAFGTTLTSPALDWGYPETRQWRDANGDGKADFCRVVGTNRELLSCTFSRGRSAPYFGRTVDTRR